MYRPQYGAIDAHITEVCFPLSLHYIHMYQRRGCARDVTGSPPTTPPIGVWGAHAPTWHDSRHTPSHARVGCGPGKLTTDPKKLRGSLRSGGGVWLGSYTWGWLGLRAPHFRTPCQLLVLSVLSKIE